MPNWVLIEKLSPKALAMHHRPADSTNDFGHFKNEYLRFLLCLLREVRFAFEAAACSKWLTYWTFFLVLGGSASWVIKTRWFH